MSDRAIKFKYKEKVHKTFFGVWVKFHSIKNLLVLTVLGAEMKLKLENHAFLKYTLDMTYTYSIKNNDAGDPA